MTGKEAFLSRLRMGGSDGTPVFLRELTLAMDVRGVPTPDVYGPPYNAKLSAACALEFHRMMGHDALTGNMHSYSLHAFGGITKYPEKGTPYLSSPPFADPSLMDGRDPSEIVDQTLEGMSESSGIVAGKLPGVAMVMNVGGPVNTAGNLRGVEAFLMDTMSEPGIARDMVRFGTDVMKEIVSFMGNDVYDTVFLAAASDNPDMLGPEGFLEYSIQSVKEITAFCKDMGLPVVFHPHGNFSADERVPLLYESVSTGIAGFQFGEGNDPATINAELSGKCSVMGGVDSFTTLLLGPDERIRRDVWKFLDVLEGDGHVATCSCSLNRGLPLGNVKAMVDAVRAWGGGE
ncbi:MAG: hypothetical protein GX224_01780 [Thermoplasmatales archaeon]|nr:hypothetical protein [Thermoplasmatales archaeon]